MGMPATSAVLNRFPGLQLKAWALFNGSGVLNASAGVTSVTVASGVITVNLSSAVNGGVYAIDFQVNSVVLVTGAANSATVCTLSTSNISGGPVTASQGGYVAVYAP